MDEEGIRMDLLEQAVREQKNVKLLYLIPTFQNPRGSTMRPAAAERRLRFLCKTRHHDSRR
jgi:Transcriptional regulators containing a DNA-binding HTH domain and an aminotransferase domain (MocR family) and their eukaryotic orthologs